MLSRGVAEELGNGDALVSWILKMPNAFEKCHLRDGSLSVPEDDLILMAGMAVLSHYAPLRRR